MRESVTLEIEPLGLLMVVSAIVSMLARRLRLPYTVGLVAAGIAFAYSPFPLHVELTRGLVFGVLLPPLIFEAAYAMSWPALRRDLPVLSVLATVGVVIAAAFTAVGMHYISGWSWLAAILVGILVSATDPVSVLATFKELGVEGRLRLMVEAESVLNDGTVAVLFAVALAATQSGRVEAATVIGMLMTTVLGGVLCGLFVGGIVLALAGKTDDHLVEITFSTVAAYGSFLLAEHFHLSGVLATLTAGILVGTGGAGGAISERGREAVESFWEYAGFVANSLVFLLIGLRLPHQPFFSVWLPLVVLVALTMAGRAFTVYGCSLLFLRTSHRVEARHQHVLVWGGLRGALALALAVGLPATMPLRETFVTVIFGVVTFSVMVQGLTIRPFLYWVGELKR